MPARKYDHDLIRELSFIDGLSIEEVVERVGCSRPVVYRVLDPELYNNGRERKRRWEARNRYTRRASRPYTGSYNLLEHEPVPKAPTCTCMTQAPDEDGYCDFCGRMIPNGCH